MTINITVSLIEAAQMLEPAIDPAGIVGKLKAHYRSGNELQKWAQEGYLSLVGQCADIDAANAFETWITANDPKQIIPNIAKYIAIHAIPEPPVFTAEVFPIFDDPIQDIPAILATCSDAWSRARDSYKLNAECAAVEAGADIATVQAAADPIQGSAAANGGSTQNTAPVYVAVPTMYEATGKKAPGDYMEQLATLGYSFRYNQMTDHIEINGKPISDTSFSEISLRMETDGFLSDRKIQHCINVVADANKYHPIKDYFKSLSWDGTEVLEQFILMMNPADPVFAGAVFSKWMISVVAKIMQQAQNQMLVLVGKQGTGKSYLARWLCPEKLQDEFFKEDPINPDDKDYKIAATNKFLWEVKELQSTTRRADVEALKGFLTTKTFNYRRPHAHFDITRPVTASYIGTLNDDESGFLTDVTGNRRFWIVEIGDIDHNYTQLYDVNDLWAEAYARWERGDSYDLTPDEFSLLTAKQETYKAINNTAEAIKQYYSVNPDNTTWIVSANEVRETLVREAALSQSDVAPRKIGAAAAELKLKKTKQRINGSSSPVWCYIGLKRLP